MAAVIYKFTIYTSVFSTSAVRSRHYIHVNRTYEEKSCTALITDLAFAYYIKDEQLHRIITMQVDDLQYCGSPKFEADVIQPML